MIIQSLLRVSLFSLGKKVTKNPTATFGAIEVSGLAFPVLSATNEAEIRCTEILWVGFRFGLGLCYLALSWE